MNYKFAFIHNIDMDQQNANMMSDSKIQMPWELPRVGGGGDFEALI